MELEAAKRLLNKSVRNEKYDDAFGDVEIYWLNEHLLLASGYFSPTQSAVWFASVDGEEVLARFRNEDALALRECGEPGLISHDPIIGALSISPMAEKLKDE